MAQRIAASLALVVFAICLISGIQAGNTFSTTVARALLAMAGTFVVGLVIGWMGQRMLDENIKEEHEKLGKNGGENARQ